MTESEWMICRDPQPMLEYLRGKTTDRKMRLFACACCRRLWSHSPNEHVGRLIETAASLADGTATGAMLQAELHKPLSDEMDAQGCNTGIVTALLYLIPTDKYDCPTAANGAAWVLRNTWRDYVRGGVYLAIRDDPAADKTTIIALVRGEFGARPGIGQILEAAWSGEGHSQAQLLRDIVGNPFRRPAVSPSWRTGHTTSVAQDIYDNDAFFRLPVLAALLAEAGCDDAEILGHCTNHEPHARGCWVVDKLLGKRDCVALAP
jgi:hypothetical protein